MTTVRTLVTIAIKRGWGLYQLDVNNVFLHGDLHEEVYMEIPQGLMVDDSKPACRLRKSLYGLKQASRQWYDKLTESLCSKAFQHSASDYSLFYKMEGSSVVFVAIYVDDEYDCLGYTTVSSPLDSTIKLKAREGALLSDPMYCRKLVGKLNFLTNTRLNIAYSVQHLSQFMQAPREPHLKAALHVLRYLKQDPTLGIFLSKDTNYGLRAYCDSNWASSPDSRKSISGNIVLLGDSPISWKSKKQSAVSLSSAEAEYRSIRKVVGELVWVKKIDGGTGSDLPCLSLCFVIVWQLFKLQEIQFFMRGLNTYR
ncbi:PREDICTED: uncharacterized protein LOC109220058 [Nicotiana attenuata]|uniref:uncharacterized protein LOC109220058 n=1 Tax=Nicotiana attenuata TaxID=49451 RepID=UPI000905C75D|nr:PREDICTED: uncharacterized protein LOC109220058 [Nicotiana attenuata]